MPNNPPNLTGKRLDKALYEALEQRGGVVLGEDHFDPAVMQSVAQLMGGLRARGLDVVSLEIPQKMVDVYNNARSVEDIKTTYPSLIAHEAEAMFVLVSACKRCGVRVMGHEHYDYYDEYARFPADMNDDERLARGMQGIRDMHSKEGVALRNDTARERLKPLLEQGERVLVISGAAHCWPVRIKGQAQADLPRFSGAPRTLSRSL